MPRGKQYNLPVGSVELSLAPCGSKNGGEGEKWFIKELLYSFVNRMPEVQVEIARCAARDVGPVYVKLCTFGSPVQSRVHKLSVGEFVLGDTDRRAHPIMDALLVAGHVEFTGRYYKQMNTFRYFQIYRFNKSLLSPPPRVPPRAG